MDAGARPTHAVWQGKVWSKEQLVTVCGLGTVTGLEGANCYHERYPFIPGISGRNWSDEWLEKKNREENTPKEFREKEYTVYEAKQKQRQMETAMRAQREKVQLLQYGGADQDVVIAEKAKYQGQLNEYARFSKEMRLKQERERIYYDMRGRVAPSKETYKAIVSGTYKNRTNKSLRSRLDYVYNGEKNFIPVGTDITNQKIIAGAGSDTVLRAANRLAEKYGGNAQDWSKFVGKIESDKYVFDVHWYERDSKMYDVKLKARKEKP